MKKGKKILGALALILFLTVSISVPCKAADFRFPSDEDGQLVVVLDPGHGGENLGADYNGYIEKEINMIVANAMYEELTKYEGITVYMTRTGDVPEDISLKNRAKFAKEVNADYLFCLHFNMSAENTFWGSEVWIQSKGQENRDGYAFASIQMETMADMGLYIRGVKTRLNDKGTDYYGILRHCKEFGIAAALIEHCHVDNDKDTPFCDSVEDLEAFGRADATSVAKYFGLSSKELGVDYSDYKIPVEIKESEEYMHHDITDPEVSLIYLEECDYENRKVTLSMTASDVDTPMLYYSYSVDGGDTFVDYFPWPDTDIMGQKSPENIRFTIDIEPGTTPVIVARAYNQYDRYTTSNVLNGFEAFPELVTEPEIQENLKNDIDEDTLKGDSQIKDENMATEAGSYADENQEPVNSLVLILVVCLFVVIGLFLVLLLVRALRRNKGQ